ncbi:MAG: hypothetical protein H0T49_05755 [Chloroflexia bacterium]|nr:hypothetical protein [Chloroflexia bacterium]
MFLRLPPPPEPETLRDNASGGSATLWWLFLTLLLVAGATAAIIWWRRRTRKSPHPPEVRSPGEAIVPPVQSEVETAPPEIEPAPPLDDLVLPSAASVEPRPTYRLEHWRGGEALAVAHTDDPEARELILASHATRLREEQTTGELVWIEEASDEIIGLQPLNPDDPFSSRAARFF